MVRITRNRQLSTATTATRSAKVKKQRAGKFALFVGDEGAILTYMQGAKVIRRVFAVSPAAEHTEAVRTLLESDKTAPITLILDSLDQSYQRHTLPPVAKMSLGKIIKRRFDRDFQPDDLKGALEIGREKTGRKDWNYLLVAVSMSGTVPQWLEICLDRDNPFRGVLLSPVACEPMLTQLVAANAHKKTQADAVKAQAVAAAQAEAEAALQDQREPANTGKPAGKKISLKKPAIAKVSVKKSASASLEWQLLISHHKVGGFRLVALHEGKMAFTRIAQPIGETSPEVIAGSIEQEAINTIEYMRRIGFTDEQKLGVVVIVSDDIRQAIDAKNIPASTHHFYTPYQAAQALKMESAAQPEDHYADVLLSVHAVQHRQRLMLHAPITQQLAAMHAASIGVRIVSVLLAVGLLGFGLVQAGQALMLQQDISTLEEGLASDQKELQESQEFKKRFPEDLLAMLDVWRLYTLYGQKQVFFPQFTLARVKPLVKEGLAIDQLLWDKSPTNAAVAQAATQGNGDRLTLSFKGLVIKNDISSFPALKERLSAIRKRTMELFPGHAADFTNLPVVFNDNSELKTTIGGDAQNDAVQRVLNEPLSIELRIIAPAETAPTGVGSGL